VAAAAPGRGAAARDRAGQGPRIPHRPPRQERRPGR
jgi:hypothetical protein